MNREEVEALLLATRPVAGPPWRDPRALRPRASRWQMVLAAACLLALIGVILAPPRRGEAPVPGDRRWLLPKEITDDPKAIVWDFVRTAKGGAAVTLEGSVWVSSDGKSSWKRLELSWGQSSAPVVEGETISFINGRPQSEGSPWELVSIDVAKKELLSRTPMPKLGRGSRIMAYYFAADGANRYLVTAGLYLSFYRSVDGGRTWGAEQKFGRTLGSISNYNPAILSTSTGLWFFHINEHQEIVCRRSTDHGTTWTEIPIPSVSKESDKPVVLRAAVHAGTVHLICQTGKTMWLAGEKDIQRLIHFTGSEDARTWTVQDLPPPPSLASRNYKPPFLKLQSGGGRLVLSGFPCGTCLQSKDGGRTWSEWCASDGIRGTLLGSSFFAGDGESLGVVLQISLDDRQHVLFREWGEAPPITPLDDAGRRAVEAIVVRLGDDDVDVRERAVHSLVSFGAPAVPILREAAKTAQDPELRSRLIESIRRIELGWPGGGAPDWWRGAADR